MRKIGRVNSLAENPRLTAYKVLSQVVLKGKSLSEVTVEIDSHEQSALIREMVFGVCRWYFWLDKKLRHKLSKPLKKKDSDVKLIVLLGFYQLQFMRAKPHAVVNETVNIVKKIRKNWAKALVNAMLRSFINEQYTPEAKDAFPSWMISAVEHDWPQYANEIFRQSQLKAPIFLRVNQQKISFENYLNKLNENSISYHEEAAKRNILQLHETMNVQALPGYESGEFSVQDAAAQQAALILNATGNMRVLDACAAPGGKTTHLKELAPTADLTALEIDNKRIERMRQNFDRLNLQVNIVCADALATKSWFKGEKFDRILLDAPCSASGVIRRHPDIKFHRQPSDLEHLVDTQAKLLQSLWNVLKAGGELLYCTCSLFKVENDLQISSFIQSVNDCEIVDLNAFPHTLQSDYGIQILPGLNDMDGFYYAKLRKRSAE